MQRHLEEQVRHHGGDGVIDPRPEFRQVVAQREAVERRTDRRRREAVQEQAFVDRERPVHQIDDAGVGARSAAGSCDPSVTNSRKQVARYCA